MAFFKQQSIILVGYHFTGWENSANPKVMGMGIYSIFEPAYGNRGIHPTHFCSSCTVKLIVRQMKLKYTQEQVLFHDQELIFHQIVSF